jgi:peptidoglycan/LPS O-acetylase OafA/YrhL
LTGNEHGGDESLAGRPKSPIETEASEAASAETGAAEAAEAGAAPPPAAAKLPRQPWADGIRVGAVLLIFLFYFGPNWQHATSTKPSASWRFISEHFDHWGIAAFVVLSGFALALTHPTSRQSYGSYVSHRLAGILGAFWLVAIPLSLAGFALGQEAWSNIWKLPLWLLGLGPVSPGTYQPISEPWWYVSLALQISLLMPLLMRLRRSLGLIPVTVFAVGLNAVVLAAVELIVPRWVHLTQGLVLSRLAELTIGMAAAELVLWTWGSRRGRLRLVEALCCLGFIMAVSPLLGLLGSWTSWRVIMVLAVLFALGALLGGRQGRAHAATRWLAWAMAISYCFYLTLAPVSKYAGRLLVKAGIDTVYVALPVALIVCVLVAWTAERIAGRWVTPRLAVIFSPMFTREKAGPGAGPAATAAAEPPRDAEAHVIE